jgi:predicted deacylase
MSHSKSRIVLPSMTPGTGRSVVYHRFGRRGARPKAYLQAAIHANELPGAMALHHLMPLLVAAERRGRIRGEIVVVPTVNPIGLAQLVGNNHLGRYDFLCRDNFNRNWLDLSAAVAERLNGKSDVAAIRAAAQAALAAMKPMSELQALRVEIMKLSVDADIVLDLHCDAEAALHLFISRRDWPGAGQTLAADIGAAATLYNDPYPASLTFSGVHSALWARLAERFPDADIPQACLSATIEYRGQHDVNHALGAADARNLFRFLTRKKLMSGSAGALPRLKAQATPIGGMDVGYAPRTGMVVYHVPKGAKVRAGEAVCEVIDPSDARGPKARIQVPARTDGIVFSRKLDGRLAWPGAVLFRIAGARLLPHRQGLSGLDD